MELFNLYEDPYEQQDLAAERPELVRLMKMHIEVGRVARPSEL